MLFIFSMNDGFLGLFTFLAELSRKRYYFCWEDCAHTWKAKDVEAATYNNIVQLRDILAHILVSLLVVRSFV